MLGLATRAPNVLLRKKLQIAGRSLRSALFTGFTYCSNFYRRSDEERVLDQPVDGQDATCNLLAIPNAVGL